MSGNPALTFEAGAEQALVIDKAITASEYRDAQAPCTNQTIVVVGSGPVGMRCVSEILKLDAKASVWLLGNEAHKPYDRVQLSSLLAGQTTRDAIDLHLPSAQDHPNFRFRIAAVRRIDRNSRIIEDSLGGRHRYDRLVLATGARPHLPEIPGRELNGVYQFRTLSDAEAIAARVVRTVHAVVIGGGLLGLEAARALLKAGTQVTVIQQGSHLMNRQLDQQAADMLRQDVEALGIRIITQAGVREIKGERRVEAVKTYDGKLLPCDTVVLCAGITPNIELARNAGLKVGRGILVDDRLQTSDSHISAIGECCEHQGQTYGLVAPGFEQAAVAANVILKRDAIYKGSMAVSRLKVVGQQVCSMGEVVDPARRPRLSELYYHDAKQGLYRKLTLHRGRVIGALAYGDWPESGRVQSLYQNGFAVWPWQRLLFRLSGRLWFRETESDVKQWPDRSIVCNCQQISKGQIVACIANGCSKVEAVQDATGAGTVCGTCKPLLAELAGSDAKQSSEKAWQFVLGASLLALCIAMFLSLWPEHQAADSVRSISLFEQIYNDKFWKQVTGFSLLGLTVVGMLMSLRKRFNFQWMGAFPYWRAVHSCLGMLSITLLIFHTGFHLGSNLNFLLMLNFLVLVVLGSSAGAVVSLGHHLKPNTARQLKKFWTWLHVIVSWPLPALLTAHIVSVYYF